MILFVNRTGKGILVFVFVCLLGGCALTPPSSESLIFKERETKESGSLGPLFPGPNYQPREPDYQFGVFSESIFILLSVTGRPKIDGELEYAEQEFAPFIEDKMAEDSTLSASDFIIRNPNYLSLSSSTALINRPHVRWDVSYGIPVVGTDVTTNLAPRTYLTANLGFGDGELIVQQKLVHTKRLGLAIGGYYRAERRGFEIEGDEMSLVPLIPISDMLVADRIFYNHIIGGRIYGYLGSPSSNLKLRAASGYAVNLREPVLNVGISIYFNSSQ